jgi:N-acetylglucosaminyl-diphospho-decaprenol L-rhamnosyltransferase
MSAQQPAPAVTVVVVNFNGGGYLRGCIASLARQTFTDFEVILVDNSSTDGSLDTLVETPPAFTVLKQDRNLGFAAANNIGARAGRGRWLALLNPDAEAGPSWLAALMRAVEARPDFRMAASLQISLHDPAKLDGAGDCYLAWGYAWRGGFGHPVSVAPSAGECFAPCGAAALYPRDVFLDAGGFDEAYFCYHEDVDIAFRLRLQGERCQFVPDASVRHAGSALSGRGSRFAVFHGVRNGVWTYVKNMPGVLLLLTSPVWVLGAILLLLRGIVRGQFRATLDGLLAGIGGVGHALRARKAIKAARRVAPADLARAFTWNPLAYPGRRIDVRPFTESRGAVQPGRPTE